MVMLRSVVARSRFAADSYLAHHVVTTIYIRSPGGGVQPCREGLLQRRQGRARGAGRVAHGAGRLPALERHVHLPTATDVDLRHLKAGAISDRKWVTFSLRIRPKSV